MYTQAVHSMNGVHAPTIAVTTPITSPAFTPTLNAFARCCASSTLIYSQR